MLSSQEIRKSFIDFFVEKKGHNFVASSSVVPLDDPTLLFTNAGMNQFKDIFLGSREPSCKRAANSQKCIRVSGKHNDLEEVGKDTYHHTFFEMLGNWSFGDYFKAEAIEWAWELLTEVWKIDKKNLWVTVFGGDQADGLDVDNEAEKLWIGKTDIAPERVLRFGRKDNFWEMGEIGPCGPCSEIHLDLGPGRCDKPNVPHTCMVNGPCGRYIELWNLVFIQYNRDETGKLTELPAKHVDTGAGLERVVSVLQKKTSNYDTDLFTPIMDRIAELSGKKYTGKFGDDVDNAFRVISDHIRTLTFAITDGALPSNDGRGYVLRRILRRATRFGLLLDINEPFLHKIVPTIVEYMGEVYPELTGRAEHVANVIESEEASFGRTLGRGIEIFESDVAELTAAGGKYLAGDKAFRLYDTYGFPLDLTQLMAEERGLTVDVAGFETFMEQQRERARGAQKSAVYEADSLSQILPATADGDKYHTGHATAKLLGYVREGQYCSEGTVPTNEKIGLVMDCTCAYAESGGQVGDKGTVEWGTGKFVFEDAQKAGSAIIHYGTTADAGLTIGSEVTVRVDSERDDVQRNHTATHLLQWALQQVAGKHAHQEGSLVTADYLRFDFTHPRALTAEQISEVEKLVRKKISEGHAVHSEVLPIDEARQLGAMALFSEKYGDEVRVLAIGTEEDGGLETAFSREFCGGTHVDNTIEIGTFKVVKEESVATGVRRITALTGRALNAMLYERAAEVDELCVLLKSTPEQLPGRVEALIENNKKLNKQLKKGAGADLKSVAEKMLADAEETGGAKIVIGEIPAAPVEAVRAQIDWFRKKAPSSVVVLGMADPDGKVMLFAAVTDDLVSKVKAGDIVKNIAPIVGGGGGGRPQMAQAGGKDPAKLAEALAAAKKIADEGLK